MQSSCAIWPSVARPAIQYFSTLPHKGHKFRKKFLKIKRVLRVYLQHLSEILINLRRTEQDMTENVYRSACKIRFILDLFERKMNFLDRFYKNTQIPNFKKIRPLGAELFHAGRWKEGRTDGHYEANCRFSQFCDRAAPKNKTDCHQCRNISFLKMSILQKCL